MKLPYRISDAASTLYRLGVSYFNYGTVHVGKQAMYDAYQTDAVSPEQAAALMEFCPDVQIVTTRSEYAPEIRRVAVLFPKAAWYRQFKSSK